MGLALSPREGRSRPQVSSAAENKTKLGSRSAWRVIGASLRPVSIADRRASLADSWLTQDKDSTRLTGPCRLLAERRLQTQALPPNTWAGSPFEQVRLLVGQHAASVPGPHMTASCLLLSFLKTQTRILPHSSPPTPDFSPARSRVPPKSWQTVDATVSQCVCHHMQGRVRAVAPQLPRPTHVCSEETERSLET